MTPVFSVRTTAAYERLARHLLKHHAEFPSLQERMVQILAADPYNRTSAHDIKKLVDVPLGDGQWRLRLRRFRFRYDIYGHDVVLQYCGLRREDTYQ